MSHQSSDISIEEFDQVDDDDSYSFFVLTTEEVAVQMKDVIHEANSVLQLPAKTMMMLLNHFEWDKEKLMEYYYDTDREKLFKKAGIKLSNIKFAESLVKSKSSTRNQIRGRGSEECSICCNELVSCKMYEMECGHNFCRPCWREYFTTKIMDEGMGQMISCMAHKCPMLVDDETVMTTVEDPKVKQRYQHLVTNSFVQANRCLKWCPSRGCTNAIQVEYTDCQPVTCSCGYSFCFQCTQEDHQPLRCDLLKKWLKKCSDDSETANWIMANTKDCPKCMTAIEKNGGCNHMRCHRCQTEFCWPCLGLWELHTDNYHCNRFNAEQKDENKTMAQSALKRYFFYSDRYLNHQRSLKLESTLKDDVEVKMKQMMDQGMSFVETQFLKMAVDTLHECRQTLMYSYAFAFYLEKNNESMIFEDNQWDLESATEILSGFLEQDMNSEDMKDIKMGVQDKYRYCAQRRQVLLTHVTEGYQNNSWVFNGE